MRKQTTQEAFYPRVNHPPVNIIPGRLTAQHYTRNNCPSLMRHLSAAVVITLLRLNLMKYVASTDPNYLNAAMG